MPHVRLSICMPTYNFGKFIGETLASILPQLTDQVEIIIVDGASTDNTAEVVGAFQKNYPQIHYHRLSKKGGIDHDMATSVHLASGDYCWLFSSDDIMNETALSEILREISSGLDVYLLGKDLWSLDMKEFLQKDFILNCPENAVFDLSEKSQRTDYFQKALNTEAFFSFMSSIVVKKSRWEETSVEDIFMDSCWGHAARIFRMIPKGLHIKYLRESFLKKRSGNDSFMDKGLVHRLAIAIDGYQKIGDIIFGNTSMEAHCIRKVLRKEIPLKFLLKAKALSTTSGECKKLIALTKKHFQDTPFLFFVGPLAISLFLHCLGKPVLMIYEKKRQAKTVLRKILKRLLG